MFAASAKKAVEANFIENNFTHGRGESTQTNLPVLLHASYLLIIIFKALFLEKKNKNISQTC